MNRRNFIKQTGIVSTAALLPSMTSCINEEAPKYKMGYQLFSVNEDMNQNPVESLKALKAMGYEDFEIYGFDPEKVSYYGIDATELKTILDDMNLTVTSGHYGFTDYFNSPKEELLRFVDQCIKGAKALNSPYITWPWLAPELRTLDNFKLLAEKLNVIGERVTLSLIHI